tara:strand:- start:13009 stop:14136 length:1128 start_codon:yes stop_codon:yes gene_type:complete
MVTVATFSLWLSLYFYVPYLPLRALELGASNTVIGLVIASYSIAQVSLRIPIGVTSDLIGKRKPFAVLALASAALGALWLAYAPTPTQMFFARSVTGIAGAGWVAVSVLYASYFTAEKTGQAMSRLMFVNGLGLVLATFVGGVISELWGTNATFLAGVILGVVGTILLLLAPEPTLQKTEPYSMQSFLEILKHPLVLIVSIVGITTQFVSFATSFGFVPIYAEQNGATDADIGFITTLMFAMSMVGTLCAVPCARIFGYRGAIVLAACLIALAAFMLPFTHTFFGIAFSQLLNGFGRGLINAVLITLSVLVVAPNKRATAMGIYQALYAIGMLSGPIIAGLVADWSGINTVFFLCTFISLAGIAFTHLTKMPKVE